MATPYPNRDYPGKDNPEKKKHEDKELSTYKTVREKKNAYCSALTTLLDDLRTLEVTQDGIQIMYERKKCSFVKTEKNYRITRNLELSVGVELIQASAEIKKNVTGAAMGYGKQNDDLVAALKAVVTTVKTAKTQFSDLRTAAFNLHAASKDSCNAGQMAILGCKKGEDCNEPTHENGKRPEACENVCELLDELIETPASLSTDIDIILNVAADVVGIQSFCNIPSLTAFQNTFEITAKAFDDVLVAKMTANGADVMAAQNDLIAAAKALTTSNYDLYNKRSELKKIDKIKNYLCDHECRCIGDCGCDNDEEQGDETMNRFKKCKCDICDIGTDVKNIYLVESYEDAYNPKD